MSNPFRKQSQFNKPVLLPSGLRPHDVNKIAADIEAKDGGQTRAINLLDFVVGVIDTGEVAIISPGVKPMVMSATQAKAFATEMSGKHAEVKTHPMASLLLPQLTKLVEDLRVCAGQAERVANGEIITDEEITATGSYKTDLSVRTDQPYNPSTVYVNESETIN